MSNPSASRCFRILWLSGCAAGALLLSSGASAQGWLAGGSFGTTKQFDYSVGGPIDVSDDSDSGYRVFGGYMFSPIQGIVTSYVDLGTANYSGSAFLGFTDALKADGIDISYVIGFAPGSQDRVNIFSTIGIFSWNQDVHYVDASGTYDYHDSGTSLSYGIGSEITLGSGAGTKWGLHFDWQRFTNVGDNGNSGHEYDREFVSVGFDYRFGR